MYIGVLQMDTGRGSAVVTKFPTKYFRIELCVESGVRDGEGYPLPQPTRVLGAS